MNRHSVAELTHFQPFSTNFSYETPHFAHRFPAFFFPNGLPPSFQGFPKSFLGFPIVFPMVSPGLSWVFPWFFPWFSRFSRVFPWFSHGFSQLPVAARTTRPGRRCTARPPAAPTRWWRRCWRRRSTWRAPPAAAPRRCTSRRPKVGDGNDVYGM